MNLYYKKSDLMQYNELGVGFVFEDDLKININKQIKKQFEKLCKRKAFTGTLTQTVWFNENGKTLLIIGLGKKNKFNMEWLRRGSICAYKTAKEIIAKKIEIVLPKINEKEQEMAQAVSEGVVLASYDYEKYKTSKKQKHEIEVFICGENKQQIEEGIIVGKIMGDAQNYARELAENPGNKLNPKTFSEEAKKFSNKHKMKIRIMDKEDLRKKGMNGILAVGKGSVHEPYLISLEYNVGKKLPFYVIVGKGVTFDTGGISLKVSDNLWEMKYDKSGACIVLAVLKAISELKLPIRILGIVPVVENMPSGSATKPGDIIKMYNGKTVEIENTDAEGRIILGDALAYGAEQKPDVIIDIATLTGAMLISLGPCACGLFSNNAKLAKKIKIAGNKTFERVWRFPIWEDYSEMIKGNFADLKNIGEKGIASSIIAAVFLKEFVGKNKWAHLDIASVDCVGKKHPLIEKGATGTGARLIIQSIIELIKK